MPQSIVTWIIIRNSLSELHNTWHAQKCKVLQWQLKVVDIVEIAEINAFSWILTITTVIIGYILSIIESNMVHEFRGQGNFRLLPTQTNI